MRATLSNGNGYDNDYCFVFEVENGLISRPAQLCGRFHTR